MTMKRINIGIFVDTFFPMTDGVAMVVDNYAKRLSKKYHVIVFAPRYLNNDFDDNVFNYDVVRCLSLKLPFVDYSLPIPQMDYKFLKELKKYHLDIVHIHSPFTIGEAGVRYAKKNHLPLVGTMHSQYKQDFLRAVKSEKMADKLTKKIIKIYNKCDECFTVNKEIARIYHEEYGYKDIPKIINNATDMQKVEDINKAYELVNQKYNLKKKEKVFLYVGRINKLKGIFFIIDVLSKLKKIDSKLSYKMLFVGTGQDEKELKKYIHELGLEKKIIFCGKITNRDFLASIYARADLFLFPSMYDTNSLVQIEASSQNTPTLFIKNSGTSAMVTNDVNGFIEENNPNSYAERIIKILNDTRLYNRVSRNAYRDLYKNWDDVTKDLEKEYLSLINKKNE